MECKFLFLCFIAILDARPTTDSSVTEEPETSIFDPDEGLPDMEVLIPDPVESVLSKHGFTYLMKYGYLPQSLLETGELRSSHDAVNAIKTFQQFANLPVTGELDTMTLAVMEKPRCGMPDIEPGETISHYSGPKRRKKRYSLVSRGWPKLELTYRIINYTPDMKFDLIRGDIHRAFKLWSDNSALTFKEMYRGNADISIHFAKKYHSDGFPFDGKGLIVAHAFYPGPGRGGDIHFDDDETWTSEVGTENVSLFSVAAHEFGHSLGLGHSANPHALMYPWYKDYYINFTLPKDDSDGIARLYGRYRPPDWKPPSEAPPTITTPTRFPHSGVTPMPKDTPDMCRTNYDCITMFNREMFVFKGKYFWRVNANGDVQTRPSITSTFFYGMVDYVDAAYQSPKYGHIVFFRRKKYWIFNGNYLQREFPSDGRPITELGLPHDIDKLDAAFVWGYNKRVYLMSGNMYWRFNEEGRQVDYDYPRDMRIWQGVPWPVDTAFVDWDGVTHFFKGTDYYTFEDTYMRVKEGFPKSSAEAWMGCAPLEKDASRSTSTTTQIDFIIFLVLLFPVLIA